MPEASLFIHKIPSCKVDKKLLKNIEEQLKDKFQDDGFEKYYSIKLNYSDNSSTCFTSINQYHLDNFKQNIKSIQIMFGTSTTWVSIKFDRTTFGSISISCQEEKAETKAQEIKHTLSDILNQYQNKKIELLHSITLSLTMLIVLICCAVLNIALNKVPPSVFATWTFCFYLGLFFARSIYPYFEFDTNPKAQLQIEFSRSAIPFVLGILATKFFEWLLELIN